MDPTPQIFNIFRNLPLSSGGSSTIAIHGVAVIIHAPVPRAHRGDLSIGGGKKKNVKMQMTRLMHERVYVGQLSHSFSGPLRRDVIFPNNCAIKLSAGTIVTLPD